MKQLIKVLILVLVCVLVILMGCVKKDYSEKKDYGVVSEPGFNQDILKVKSLEIEKQTTYTELKVELEEFKSFSDEFFPIWSEHINRTSTMLDDFNSNTIVEEKSVCSKELEQRYLEFKVNLENMKPPGIAATAYNLAVEAVSYRVTFFKKFNENAPVKELNEIESKAYIDEASFWDEIDKIYKYFDEEIVMLNIFVLAS